MFTKLTEDQITSKIKFIDNYINSLNQKCESLSPPDLKNLHSKAVKKERLSSSGIRPFFFASNNALNA